MNAKLLPSLSLFLVVGLRLFAESASAAPLLRVVSQGLKDDAIIVSEVRSPGPGWVAVHVENDGVPGEVIGVAPVPAGETTFLYVRLDLARVAAKLVAVLHEDKGTRSAFEFPGPDVALATAAGAVASRFVLAGCRGAVNCNVDVTGSPIEDAFQ